MRKFLLVSLVFALVACTVEDEKFDLQLWNETDKDTASWQYQINGGKWNEIMIDADHYTLRLFSHNLDVVKFKLITIDGTEYVTDSIEGLPGANRRGGEKGEGSEDNPYSYAYILYTQSKDMPKFKYYKQNSAGVLLYYVVGHPFYYDRSYDAYGLTFYSK